MVNATDLTADSKGTGYSLIVQVPHSVSIRTLMQRSVSGINEWALLFSGNLRLFLWEDLNYLQSDSPCQIFVHRQEIFEGKNEKDIVEYESICFTKGRL